MTTVVPTVITSYLTRDILAIYPGVNFSFFTNQMRQLKTRFTEGTMHVLSNQDLGFSVAQFKKK